MSSASARSRSGSRLSGAERREQILDATLALAAGAGFQAVSIDAVAREAGITRPIVYGHFTDLRGLLNALADRERARALAQLAKVVPAELDPRPAREIAVAALRGYLEAVAAEPLTWRLVLMPVEGSPAVLRGRVAGDREAIRRQIVRLLSAGLEREGITAPVDAELAAHAVQAYAEEAARLVLTDPEGYPVDRLVAFADLLLTPLG
jgi:AcrR family transcriptional regulator